MREYKRQSASGLRMRLVRRADGGLRSATEGTGIGDVWAEQKRIRLAEAIKEDQRKVAKKQLQKQRFKRAKTLVRSAPKKLRHLKISTLKSGAQKQLRKASKKQLFISGAVVALIALTFLYGNFSSSDTKDQAKLKVTNHTLNNKTEKPSYSTLLPEGKTIDQLGGWRRVSPADRTAVFAYVDNINGIQVSVSQQPLPHNFEKNTQESISKLAEQFTANKKIEAGDTTAYLGTSEKGPQSVIFAKQNLLILIKSSQQIPDEIWGVYIATLKE
jgi:hypothetical protein